MKAEVRAALLEALDLEYRAEARAEAAIAAFGPVRPFVGIAEAERRHVDELIRLFERFGLSLPPNGWRGRLDPPSDLATACGRAVKDESETLAAYDRLLAVVGDEVEDGEIAAVFRALRDETQCKHLPAVQDCAGQAAPLQST
jgi:hypothetical protein